MAEVDRVAQIERPDEMRRSLSGRARTVLLVVFALASALHLYSWYVHPNRPSLRNGATMGWYGAWADQLNYAREARALADGLLPGTYWDYDRGAPKRDRPPDVEVSDYAYGLGYPVLGVPFMNLGLRRDPFVIPDMVAFGLIICLALQLARRFMSGVAALVFAGVLAVASPVLAFTVIPWNTTITAVAVLAALVVATSERRDWKIGALVGLALSLCYAARFSDVLWPMLIVAVGIAATWRRNVKGCVAVVAVAAGMLAATYLVVGWTQHVVFGHFFTNPYHYHFHEGNRGDSFAEFRLGQVPRAFTEVFITAKPGGRRVPEPHTSVLRVFPWVVAAPFGLAMLIRRRHRHLGPLVVASAASLVASALYLSYWSGTGADLVHNNLRFFVPWFPLWGLLAAVALTSLAERSATALHAGSGAEPQSPSRPPNGTRHRWMTAVLVVIAATLAVVWYVNRPVVIDLVERFPGAQKRPVSATEQTFAVRSAQIGGETRRAIYAHPPTRITWTVTLPGEAQLRAALGIDPQAWDLDGDGVLFRVGVNDGEGYKELWNQHVDPRHTPGDRRWIPIMIDLTRFGGRRVDIIFNTNTSLPGKGDDARNDLALWGAPAIWPSVLTGFPQ